MPAWLQRAYWSFMLRTSKTATIKGLPLIYISAEAGRPSVEIQAALLSALNWVEQAKGGFGELVVSHLRFVAALEMDRSVVVTHARGLISSFPLVELQNPFYLACRLVWAATFVRLMRDARKGGRPRDPERIRQLAVEAQVRFVGQFPDAGDWHGYLERHPTGI